MQSHAVPAPTLLRCEEKQTNGRIPLVANANTIKKNNPWCPYTSDIIASFSFTPRAPSGLVFNIECAPFTAAFVRQLPMFVYWCRPVSIYFGAVYCLHCVPERSEAVLRLCGPQPKIPSAVVDETYGLRYTDGTMSAGSLLFFLLSSACLFFDSSI